MCVWAYLLESKKNPLLLVGYFLIYDDLEKKCHLLKVSCEKPLNAYNVVCNELIGIWIIKIHLNPKIQSRQSLTWSISYFLLIKHSLHQYSHFPALVWSSTNTGKSSSLFLAQLLQIPPLLILDISVR